MIAALAYALALSQLLGGAVACTFSLGDSLIYTGPYSAAVPVSGLSVLECAGVAQAFAMPRASVRMVDSYVECLVFEGASNATTKMVNAHTISDITGCDMLASSVMSTAINMSALTGSLAKVGEANATLAANIAPVGKGIHTEQTTLTLPECLSTCQNQVMNCTHVAAVNTTDGVRCSFYSNPTKGLPAEGTSLYYNIAAPKLLAANAYEAFLRSPVDGTCPKPAMVNLPTGRHKPFMKAPAEAVKFYKPGQLDVGNKFPMKYYELENGDAYCVSDESTSERIIVGGMYMWEGLDGTCVPPPAKPNGQPCCSVYMWQPNAIGLYYDNCSMKMDLAVDGFYYFETEMPGDESDKGWGPDPEPHIHYDIACEGCAATNAFNGNEYAMWSKFYQVDVCTLPQCGNAHEVHKSSAQTIINGKKVFKFDFVLSNEPKGEVM